MRARLRQGSAGRRRAGASISTAPPTRRWADCGRNGHAEPYRIQFWQIGNERAGKDYEARLPAFCEAMQKVDPCITLLSSYPTAGVLAKAGPWLDYVCPHHYACENLTGMENDLLAVRDLIHRHGLKRPIRIAVTEWNTTAGDWGPAGPSCGRWTTRCGCARYHNLLHRHADLVEIANRSNLSNSFCSGIIQTDNHRLYKTPTYYAQQLYATRAGTRPLRIDSPLPANTLPDISATLSADGNVLTIFAVNPTLHDVTRPLDLSAFGARAARGDGVDADRHAPGGGAGCHQQLRGAGAHRAGAVETAA